jgi:hypothetical protein
VKSIVARSVPVSQDWSDQYSEAPLRPPGRRPGRDVVVPLTLPSAEGTQEALAGRRSALAEFEQNRGGLMNLFRDCANGRITSPGFYKTLDQHWGGEVGGRLQGRGFQIKGKHSNFQALSKSFLKIVDADDDDRDDVTIAEIDRLAEKKIPTRSALLLGAACSRSSDDPKPPFEVGPMNGQSARESGLRLKAQVAPGPAVLGWTLERSSDAMRVSPCL